jgi:starch synthase
MKILFAASECVPYAKTGGLADVAAALPAALREKGVDARVIMPRYRAIPTEGLTEAIGGLAVPVSTRTVWGKVLQGATGDGVPIYFLDQPQYFDRAGLYVDGGKDYADNAERFIFFSRAIVEFCRKSGFTPDVIHCNDWFTGLVPVYLKTLYAKDKAVREIRTVFSIHNLAYQGVFWHYDMHLTGFPWSLFRFDRLEFYGKLNFLKGGLVFADAITTVSERYSREIRTPEFGCGLDPILTQRADALTGIVNGVDYGVWNPASDPHLADRYDADRLDAKLACKRDLQRLNNLPESDAMLIGIIGRMIDQKGFDLISQGFEQLMAMGVQVVLLGTGEDRYHEFFRDVARKHPLQTGINLTFSDELAHKIEAGADVFLMPSRFEPCGLNQLYSLRYGTPPVVRSIGGLADTVTEWNPKTGEGTGFLFETYDLAAMLEAIRRAHAAFGDRAQWRALQANGMRQDWSWASSAGRYLDVYGKILGASRS